MFPGILETTPFTNRKLVVNQPRFIKPIHPKASIAPTPEAIKNILKAGWWGQVKIHGHRAQIHLPAKDHHEIVVFNRQGQLHQKKLPEKLAFELMRVFKPKKDWNVIDGEWLKATDQLFIFDALKWEGRLLDRLSYQERFSILPRVFGISDIQVLSPLRTVEACLQVLYDVNPVIEGLVFKSPTTKGFSDTAVVRCRRQII